ncbi:MAG: CCA tRNA nucleotidyltransferase [Bdellovibrionales bacterium]|nr:CCA tRNA nucleotidyltransferase [Bdellovibrionales bacterium]
MTGKSFIVVVSTIKMSPLHNEKPTSPVTQSAGQAVLSSVVSSKAISEICEALGDDAQLHLVGGVVRDALCGISQCDIDLATVLRPGEVSQGAVDSGLRVIETGISHGTVTILVDNTSVELTTFRVPGPREGGAFSETILEDLSGRDFTINAIAFSVDHQEFIDPFGGIQDLKDGLLRAVGNPEERFLEDPLRILRMIRFGAAAGRKTEPSTFQAGKKLVGEIASVSPERIREELVSILLRDHVRVAFEQMHEIGLLSCILPELEACVGFDQNEYHSEDVFHHTLTVVERAPREKLLRLAALFHDIGKPDSLTIGEDGRRHFFKHEIYGEEIAKRSLLRLHFSKREVKEVCLLVRQHMRPLDCGPSGLRRIMRDLGEFFDEWLKLKRADKSPAFTEEEFQAQFNAFLAMLQAERARTSEPEYGKLAVNGCDLQQIGVPPGPQLGEVLRVLEEEVIENPSSNTQETLLEIARRYLELPK